MTQPKPILLMILDGWGYREASEYNAIAQANTPTWDHLWATYPHTLISASGLDVGLPTGQMGNSEVGHLHMGAGRLVPQDLVRVNQAIENKRFFENSTLCTAVQKAIAANKSIHILGLLSPGGVHSHENHIQAMIEHATQQGAKNVYLHAILDGRDTPPRSALTSIAKMEKCFHDTNCGKIASITGRYYAMDRDQRWDRIELAYRMLTEGVAPFSTHSAADALEQAYERDEGDEFVQPTLVGDGQKVADGDVVIFMNFRADRARQLSHAFLDETFDGFQRDITPSLSAYVTLTKYASNLKTDIAFPPVNLHNVLGEYLANNGKKQLRIAETEKYAHVTFFFNGGRERAFEGEDRVLVNSPKVATYDLQPEMAAPEVTDELISAIQNGSYDTIILNFANADMVGHTGKMDATITAIETLDTCLEKIKKALDEVGGEMLITADHGNAEFMYNEAKNQPHTAHTTNLIPLLYVGRDAQAKPDGTIVDIAPTMCRLLGLDQPPEMTGQPLFEFN